MRSWTRASGSPSRLTVVGISRTFVVTLSLAVSGVAAGACWVCGLGFDRTLGIAGTVLAVCTFVLTQYQQQGPAGRKVVMIPKSRSPFSSSVAAGVSEVLGKSSSLSLSVEWPESIAKDEVEWQLSLLRTEACTSADAIIMVPAGDDERLWEEVVRLSRHGVFFVVVDTKPENAFFVQRNAPRPFFVGSDFTKGGEIIGAEIVAQLRSRESRQAVIALGPARSWPAMERTRSICAALALAGVAGKATAVELESWNREACAGTVADALTRALEGTDSGVIGYCGNDKVMRSVERRLNEVLDTGARRRVGLVGYDGATSAEGQLLLDDCALALATVDTRPVEQGRVAAAVVVDEHSGLLEGRGSQFIEPHLVRSKIGDAWLAATESKGDR